MKKKLSRFRYIVSRSGPRAVDGLEEYAKILHPEFFNEVSAAK